MVVVLIAVALTPLAALAVDCAELSIKETIVFDVETIGRGETAEKIGRDKLRYCGHSEDMINTFDDETLRLIAGAEEATRSISYYAEVSVSDNENEMEMVKVSQESFVKLQHNDLTDLPETLVSVAMPGKIEEGVEKSASASVDGGRLFIVTTLYRVQDPNPSRFMLVSEFCWTSMPRYRGKDVFGITRGGNTSVVPGGFRNYVKYTERRIRYFNTGTGIIASSPQYYTRKTTNFPNDDNVAQGYAIKYNLPKDYMPSYLMPGTSLYGSTFYGLCGGVSCIGGLQQYYISQEFNHWSTYYHQKGGHFPWSVSFSYPFGASIGISGYTAAYSPKLVDTVLHNYIIH